MSVQDSTTLDSSTPGTTGVLLSDPAAAKVKALLDQEGRDDLRLRIAVQPGGCSGLRYQLFFDERFLDGDQTYEFDGVEAVRAQIFDERGTLGHLVGIHVQVLDDDLLNALGNIAHWSTSGS